MKLKFDANQQFQLDAISAVVDVFDGQPPNKSDFEISFTSYLKEDLFSGLTQTELGLANQLTLDNQAILNNIKRIQERNELPFSDVLEGETIPADGENVEDHTIPYITVEMETGTGKTYVYLRTIFELNQKYGFKKFIIVVPSVAIREGVNKNIDITRDHFRSIYSGVEFDAFIYDSKNINALRQFATSNTIQIMIINIDAFRKTLEDAENPKLRNVIYRENDRLSGRKPIDYVQATNPIVIIDEPQSVDNTPLSKQAIAMLNPLCTLRYSATHLDEYNLVYKLDPVKAFELKLVKQIAVASVLDEEDFNDAYVKLLEVDNRNGISARLEFHEETNGTPKLKIKKISQGADLFTLSNERAVYRDNFIVDEINTEPGNEYVRFTGGLRLTKGESSGGLTDEIRKIQIKNTVQEHLEKERQLKDKGIKVLSLLFIDRVEKYRQYDDENHPIKGIYALWFEEIYQEMLQRPEYAELNMPTVDQVHNGYFAIDNKGRAKNTLGDSLADQSAYDLIMKEKEELLSLSNPLKFIFSHSALREGWDNPNVFQICTLNETASEIKKRQEIGRGLRLPVNQDGERVFDSSINKLVVIANEHYEAFASKLQTEYETNCGVRFGHVPTHAFAKIDWVDQGDNFRTVSREESMAIFSDLWERDYINGEGKILPKFSPLIDGFELELADKYQPIKNEIINVIQSYQLERHIVNNRTRRKLVLNKQVFDNEDFKILWHKINQKTRYSVEFNTNDLVTQIVAEISRMEQIEPAKISVRKGDVKITKAGITTSEVRHQINLAETHYLIPDILAYLQRETELTRQTLFRILTESQRLPEFVTNPQRFMDQVVVIIRKILHQLMINGIKYEKVAGEEYEMRLFEEKEIIEYLNSLISVNKSVYDSVVYESEVERKFAEELDRREDIKLFIKLPKWFIVDTPIGTYNPDWAVLKQNGEALYLVRETKGTRNPELLRNSEGEKIQCGKKHFQELGIDFKTVVTASEV